MAEPAKYLFDRSFAKPGRAGAESLAERKLRADFERQLAETRRAAFEEGAAEGERRARATVEGETARALAAILAGVERMQAAMGEECDAIHGHAVQVALAVAERLSRTFLRREPLAELEALFAECLGLVAHTPQIAVRVNDALAAPVRARFEAIAESRGYQGQVRIAGDPAIAPGDCQMEWAEGGINRDFEATLRNIEEAIRRHLDARRHELELREAEPRVRHEAAAPAGPDAQQGATQ